MGFSWTEFLIALLSKRGCSTICRNEERRLLCPPQALARVVHGPLSPDVTAVTGLGCMAPFTSVCIYPCSHPLVKALRSTPRQHFTLILLQVYSHKLWFATGICPCLSAGHCAICGCQPYYPWCIDILNSEHPYAILYSKCTQQGFAWLIVYPENLNSPLNSCKSIAFKVVLIMNRLLISTTTFKHLSWKTLATFYVKPTSIMFRTQQSN